VGQGVSVTVSLSGSLVLVVSESHSQ